MRRSIIVVASLLVAACGCDSAIDSLVKQAGVQMPMFGMPPAWEQINQHCSLQEQDRLREVLFKEYYGSEFFNQRPDRVFSAGPVDQDVHEGTGIAG